MCGQAGRAQKSPVGTGVCAALLGRDWEALRSPGEGREQGRGRDPLCAAKEQPGAACEAQQRELSKLETDRRKASRTQHRGAGGKPARLRHVETDSPEGPLMRLTTVLGGAGAGVAAENAVEGSFWKWGL